MAQRTYKRARETNFLASVLPRDITIVSNRHFSGLFHMLASQQIGNAMLMRSNVIATAGGAVEGRAPWSAHCMEMHSHGLGTRGAPSFSSVEVDGGIIPTCTGPSFERLSFDFPFPDP